MFHLMERGEGWIRLPQHLPVRLVPGEVVLVRAGIAHDVVSSPTARPRHSVSPSERPLANSLSYRLGRGEPRATIICGAFHFGPAVEHPLLTLLPDVLHLAESEAPDAVAMVTLLRQVAREAVAGRPGADLIVRRLTSALFAQILRAWLEAQPAGGGWLAAMRDPQIGAALAAIHHAPARRWTVAALGREAAMSRSLFAARFPRLVGEPPLHYVARWRVLMAAQALREGRGTVASIATMVGYASLASFGRAFTRFVGVGPAAYRARSFGRAPGSSAAILHRADQGQRRAAL